MQAGLILFQIFRKKQLHFTFGCVIIKSVKKRTCSVASQGDWSAERVTETVFIRSLAQFEYQPNKYKKGEICVEYEREKIVCTQYFHNNRNHPLRYPRSDPDY